MLHDGTAPSFSATDLVNDSACPQRSLPLSGKDRLREMGKASPERLIPDPRLDPLGERVP